MEDLIKLLPETPPADLLETVAKKSGAWDVGFMIYKCISQADAEAMLDCENTQGDYRVRLTNEPLRPAVIWCSECEREMIVDYRPRTNRGSWTPPNSGIRLEMPNEPVEREIHNGQQVRCPCCGKIARLVHKSEMAGGRVRMESALVPTVKKHRLILTEWVVSQWVYPYKTDWYVIPYRAYMQDGKAWKQFTHAKYTTVFFGEKRIKPLEQWEPRKHLSDELINPYLYKKHLPSLNGTSLENSKLWEYERATARGSVQNFFPLAYLRLYQHHPEVENLVMAGLAAQLGQMIREDAASGQYGCFEQLNIPKLAGINWKAAKPAKMLSMTKPQLKEYGRSWTGVQMLSWVKYGKDRATIEEFTDAWAAAGQAGTEYMMFNRLPIRKTLNYLRKQKAEWATLKDYWNITAQAGGNLQDEAVRWPRELSAAHDRAVVENRYQIDAASTEAFVAMTKMCEGLKWEHDGICIRPAATPQELVHEGNTLHHCVGGYSKSHAAGRIVLFIRHSRRPERSWYTLNVDVRTHEIIQNHGYRNERLQNGKILKIPENVKRFVELWEKQVFDKWTLGEKPAKKKPANPAA